jgi:translation elongation factor P/translation initiation factor 5A
MTLDSDIAALAMLDGILSDGEREKLREMREIAKVRIDVRVRSMREAREILEAAKKELDEAIVEKARLSVTYDEAMLAFADDEDDDWETASKKAFKFEKVEAEFLSADGEVAKARKKLNKAWIKVQWELREAQRMGFADDKES